MTFGPFDIPDNELLEACKRLERGKAIRSVDVLISDLPAQSIEVVGRDGTYRVTLSDCECVDFYRRQLPCKHMYRLALELGFSFDKAPAFDPYFAAEFDISEEIERLEKRWLSGQLTMDAFSKCVDALHSSAALVRHKRGRPRKKT